MSLTSMPYTRAFSLRECDEKMCTVRFSHNRSEILKCDNVTLFIYSLFYTIDSKDDCCGLCELKDLSQLGYYPVTDWVNACFIV